MARELTYEPPRKSGSQMQEKLWSVGPLDGPPITIAVYGFADRTGQRKSSDRIALLSTAVTQGAEAWVVNALWDVGKGTWFLVVERSGLDNLVKERQIIRTTRDLYKSDEGNALPPLKFAGVLLEGGIIGYDSNIVTGGSGARFLGIGAKTEYRSDQVTIAMRLVSVQSGQVVLAVATEKKIYSVSAGGDMFKFVDAGLHPLEIELGFSANEPANQAVRLAVEAGVLELVSQGIERQLWRVRGDGSVLK